MKKIKDSRETLEAGLKAEQETIIEYTKYLNEAKNNGNESEVKIWEHIIKDEEEHVREFENALEGNFNIEDSEDDEIVETFLDNINDCLVENGINGYKVEYEDPIYYIDFEKDKELCETAYQALRDSFFKCDFIDDDGFYFIKVTRR